MKWEDLKRFFFGNLSLHRQGTAALRRYKLVVVGDGACGKTSLLTVFQTGIFPVNYQPTIFNTSGVQQSLMTEL